MSQDVIAVDGGQDLSGFKTGTETGYKTGAVVPKSGLYKATDGKTEFIELMDEGSTFPPYPGGNGSAKTTWYRVTPANDGARASFTSVKVAAGTM